MARRKAAVQQADIMRLISAAREAGLSGWVISVNPQAGTVQLQASAQPPAPPEISLAANEDIRL